METQFHQNNAKTHCFPTHFVIRGSDKTDKSDDWLEEKGVSFAEWMQKSPTDLQILVLFDHTD